MQTDTKTANKLATEIVGDGKRPNKYFVTIGYGWYKPAGEDTEAIQAKNSLDSQSILFTNREDAETCFDHIILNAIKPTGQTISQVMIEDRLTGVVKEKFIEERNGRFYIVHF